MDLVSIAITIGLPILVVLFYLDGLIVGKVFQPSLVFIGYVAVVDHSWSGLLVAAVACLGSATAGQWTLYRLFSEDAAEFVGVRRTVPYLESVPTMVLARIPDNRMRFVERQFDRFGGTAICVTNVLPGIRGFAAIIAGLSDYPARRFLLATAAGNGLYVLWLLAVSWGILEVVRFVLTP